MSAAFIPHKLIVLGGTGNLGSKITQALLDKKAFEVKVVVRKESIEKKKDLIERFKLAGAIIVEGDTSDVASLTEVLKGSDTVVSVIGSPQLNAGHALNIVEAAKAAGVKRVIPSEFAGLGDDEADWLNGAKAKARTALIASGLEYTIIATSAFYEFLFGDLIGFTFKEGKVRIPENGKTRVSATHTKDIAKYVTEILLDPTTVNQKLLIAGETLTYDEAVKIFEEEYFDGKKKIEVEYVSFEELQKIESDLNQEFYPRVLAKLKLLLFKNSDMAFSYEHRDRFKNVTPLSVREYARSLKQQS